MWKLLSILQKNLVWSIPVSMVLGLFFGYFFDASPLKQFIIPVTFVMVYPMMVTLNVKSVFKGHDTKLQIATQVINFILVPLLAFYTGRIFFAGGAEKYAMWAVGLFLIGVLPTSGMTISWTGFARGNKEAAIKMVVFGLVLGSLAAPVYTKVFMGATINVDMLHMFKQIALFVFIPLFAGLATQAAGRRKYGDAAWNERIKPKFPPFSALGVTLIAFVAMSLKAKHIIANPGDIISILVPLAVFYLISYGVLSLVGKLFFKRGDAVAMVFGVVMRDLSIALAIAMTAFGKQGMTIALLIAMAYVIQIQSAAWYVRFVDRIFGTAEARKRPASVPAGNVVDIKNVPGRLPVGQAPVVPGIGKILYATDLSNTARHAVKYACSIGDRYGAEVSVLHVIPDLVEKLSAEVGVNLADHVARKEWETFHSKGIEHAKEAIHRRIRQTSRDVAREIPQCPLARGEVMVRVGNPVDQIIATAEEGGFDLVVMGTHGHGKVEETITGSVATEVIRRCMKPVMVIRLPREDKTMENVSGPKQGLDPQAPAQTQEIRRA